MFRLEGSTDEIIATMGDLRSAGVAFCLPGRVFRKRYSSRFILSSWADDEPSDTEHFTGMIRERDVELLLLISRAQVTLL